MEDLYINMNNNDNTPLNISPLAMKSGDKITFNGPQFPDLYDKALIKELKEKNDKLQKELTVTKQCIIGILESLEIYQQEQQNLI